jgi:pimeloyl-ACP methyl ester carboxylesterase
MSTATRTSAGTVRRDVARVHRQLGAIARNGLVRPGADPEYADGDDSTWMDVDWPALTRRIDIDGRTVSVVDTGGEDKPALVWIHGLSGLWQNWLLNIPAFMDRYRCIAPDLPGFGASEMPREDITIEGYARTVDRVCDTLGVDGPAVIGNSMGGFVGAELAISFPTRVDKLVLVSAAGLSTEYYAAQPLLVGARIWALATARAGAQADAVVRRKRLRRIALQGVLRYPEKLSGPLTWELVQGASTPGFMQGLKANLNYSVRDRLARIEVPTLIVWGRNDIIVPVGDALRYQRLIGPNARAEVFEDTGHVPMLERPSRFNRLLDAFLAGRDEPEREVGEVEGVSG